MAFDYAGLRSGTVEPLLAEYGKPATLYVNVVTAGANPWDSQITSEQAFTVTVVQTGFSKSDVEMSLVEAGDVKFLVSTNNVSFDPDLADRIQLGDDVFQVTMIEPLQPGPVVMLWTVYARK